MYKIYINEKPLIITDSISILDSWHSDSKTLITPYLGKPKQLLQYVDMLSKNSLINRVIIHDQNYKQVMKSLKGLMNVVPACGGLVFNNKGKLLVIFRRGFWDLPKGKIEKNETKRETAVREVMEETGLNEVSIGNKIGKTYHMFKNKSGKKALKLSYWYMMTTPNSANLVPQIAEDIEICEWVDPKKFLQKYDPIFNNIRDILEKHLAAEAV